MDEWMDGWIDGMDNWIDISHLDMIKHQQKVKYSKKSPNRIRHWKTAQVLCP